MVIYISAEAWEKWKDVILTVNKSRPQEVEDLPGWYKLTIIKSAVLLELGITFGEEVKYHYSTGEGDDAAFKKSILVLELQQTTSEEDLIDEDDDMESSSEATVDRTPSEPKFSWVGFVETIKGLFRLH
jgi:hypothetical protein